MKPSTRCLLLTVLWLAIVMTAGTALGQSTYTITLGWDANTTDPGIAGYKLYYGTNSGVYSLTNDVGNITTASVSGLLQGVTYYFAVTDYNTLGEESLPSNEVSYQLPIPGSTPPPTVTLLAAPSTVIQGQAATLQWTSSNATTLTWVGYGSVSLNGSAGVWPNATTTYTVTATGPGGTASATVTVTVTTSTPPPTATLAASPTTINSGQSATLTWTSANTTSVTLSGVGSVAASGSVSVTPSVTTTYTLTATGAGGTTSANATVTVTTGAPTPIVTLTASPTTVTNGQFAILQWTSSNATGLTWVGYGPVSLNGNAGVWPSATTVYTVTALGPGGTASATAMVTVADTTTPPPTATLIASPTTINSGQSATLTWTSANAASVTLSGAGSVAANGSVSVTPSVTTTYTLTATGTGGTTSANATVTVTSGAPAPIVTLTASPTTVTNGQFAILQWTSSNATDLTWVGYGPVSLNGNAGVWPSTTTTYTVVGVGPGGTNSASATVSIARSLASLMSSAPLPNKASLMSQQPTNPSAGHSSSSLDIHSLTVLANGQLQLQVSGQPAQGFGLLVSTDLVVWQELRRGVAPSDEFILVFQANRSPVPTFYRLKATTTLPQPQ